MGRTFIRQDTQIRKSDVYTDSTAPTEAAFETNPVNIEDDLNNVRSQLHNLLKNQAGNWWDDLNTPSTFENGAERGVNDLNQDLHDLERQRILRRKEVIGADVTVPSCVAATGTLTLAGNASDTETVTIGTQVYTFNTSLGGANSILIGVSASISINNLIAAINNGGGEGTLYGTGTPLNSDVTAAAGAGDTMDVTAKTNGSGPNSVVTSETLATVGSQWGAGTLTGGAGDVVILGTGELPGNTTAAVDVVTTLGTVVAYEASFGAATLTEVAGGDALTPKNLVKIANTNTGEPILDGSGNEVHGLLQSESNTDGHTITDTTTTRAQISFVVHNNTNDDLELVDCAYIGGQSIDYSPVERYAFADMPETAWLGDDFVDVGAAATTRQSTYDNQGVVAVDQSTNAILDLESAGIYWEIRDDLEATLFRVTEGSAGSNSTVAIEDDVDNFDVDALDVDFDAGISIRSGGSRSIDIGINDGVVESTAGDLEMQAVGEIWLDDGNKPAGWSLTQGIKLSEEAQNWTDFETKFGGEVSLMEAIIEAYDHGARGTKVYANCTLTTNEDVDVGGTGGGANLDSQLPDMSTGTFLTDYDVFVNGELIRPGADASANNDYYPGTSLTLGQLKFEFKIKANDVLCVIPYS